MTSVKFPKSVQYREVDAKPLQQYLIKLFDNKIYDLLLEKFESANGKLEIRIYLNFKRNQRLHIATMCEGIWTINQSNSYNEFISFGKICKNYSKEVEQGIIKLCQEPKEVKTNLSRYFTIFIKRRIKQYF